MVSSDTNLLDLVVLAVFLLFAGGIVWNGVWLLTSGSKEDPLAWWEVVVGIVSISFGGYVMLRVAADLAGSF